MIEIIFAVVLGFAIASTLCGFLDDGSRGDKVLIRTLIYLIILSTLIAFMSGGNLNIRSQLLNLVMGGVFDHTIWFLFGAALAIGMQLLSEGHFHQLWIRFHPQSAPTPEVEMGRRAKVAGFRQKPVAATLVGTSTEYLNSELDLRTETLIRLCYSTFEDRSALMMSRLESSLRLGTGRRQKSFHKIVAGHRGRPKAKRIAHRYWRSVNGSSRLTQSLFGELCNLARATENRDRMTVERLSNVGHQLGLTPEEMGRAIRGAL